ncbi:hypothetical protein NDU88_007138 [Pleurodeles waltl]|uniref:Uncharacterized protein n=1 Tax=Pleurodeles waltl TaxID=8319 RepID=A0AAV7NST4_PLEWA|nr:hypothetical protein NDU88_007138 [Pleurodeles waltl]
MLGYAIGVDENSQGEELQVVSGGHGVRLHGVACGSGLDIGMHASLYPLGSDLRLQLGSGVFRLRDPESKFSVVVPKESRFFTDFCNEHLNRCVQGFNGLQDGI